MLTRIALTLMLAAAPAAARPLAPSTPIAMDVTGSDITDAQINAVRDFEVTLLDDPDPDVAAAAQGWVDICDKALNGNPKDRSKVARRYNELVDAGAIQPV